MKIKSAVVYYLGKCSKKLYDSLNFYKNQEINSLLGGGNRRISYPFHILGVKNIQTEDNINIGSGATLFTTGAKLIIKQHFVSGPNLTIITGDHMPIVGCFVDTVSAADKARFDVNHECDQDVVIEEDVWCGVNVTILKGVTIGRGSIIAAGAVVTKSIPPYSIAGGVPAKPLKTRWTLEQIMEHEKVLYPVEKRFTKEQLEILLYSK